MSIIRRLVDKWAAKTYNRGCPKEMPTKLVIADLLYHDLQTNAPIAVFLERVHLTRPLMKLILKFTNRWHLLFYKEYPIYCDWPPEYYPEEGLDERWKKKEYDTY